MKDGKAIQKNIAIDDAEAIGALAQSHSQINILTTLGDAEFKCSKSGKELLSGDRKIKNAISSGIEKDKIVSAGSNDRKKNHILSGNESFLGELGICDKNGRIHDKKQHKFRQICRFLEYVEDIYPNLPREGKLLIYDLCCGKSYLSFAVYHYFAVIKGRKVKMTGVDLKADVIEYCSSVASRLGYRDLNFICGDINDFAPGTEPHLVVSLHACDIATDNVGISINISPFLPCTNGLSFHMYRTVFLWYTSYCGIPYSLYQVFIVLANIFLMCFHPPK